MTGTEIRAALTDVRDAVEVPPVDEVGFRARLRSERRRRATGRALAGTAAAAAVTTGAVLIATLPGGTAGDSHPQPFADGAAPSPVTRAPLVVQRRFELLLPDSGSYAPGLKAEDVLGATPGGVVVVDDDSRLLYVPVAASGDPGRPESLADGQAVQTARLDKAGRLLTFVDLDDRVHVRRVRSDQDLATAGVGRGAILMAADSGRWIEDDGARVRVRTADASVDLAAPSQVLGADLAGGTAAVATMERTTFFDADTGARRAAGAPSGPGSLSPDGTRYAVAAGDVEKDRGEQGVVVVDTDTGAQRDFAGYPDDDATAVWLTWQDDDRFLVVAMSAIRTGNRVLYDCSVAAARCVERLDDPSGTLQVATR